MPIFQLNSLSTSNIFHRKINKLSVQFPLFSFINFNIWGFQSTASILLNCNSTGGTWHTFHFPAGVLSLRTADIDVLEARVTLHLFWGWVHLHCIWVVSFHMNKKLYYYWGNTAVMLTMYHRLICIYEKVTLWMLYNIATCKNSIILAMSNIADENLVREKFRCAMFTVLCCIV